MPAPIRTKPIVNPATVRAVQQPAETRRGNVERARQVQAQIFQVYGRIDLKGAGEVTYDANFPVWFTEIPQLSFGGELGGNKILVAGNFPRISVMVRSWVTTVRAGGTYYSGAQFVAVLDGPADMAATAHWQCEGTGLTNPLLSDTQLAAAL
jgi:hypothetical protein